MGELKFFPITVAVDHDQIKAVKVDPDPARRIVSGDVVYLNYDGSPLITRIRFDNHQVSFKNKDSKLCIVNESDVSIIGLVVEPVITRKAS